MDNIWGENLTPDPREGCIKNEDAELRDRLGERAYRYASRTTARDSFIDALVLVHIFEQNCMLMPMCLGLEAVLFEMADGLGMSHTSTDTIGVVFRKENIEKALNKITDIRERHVVDEQLATISGFIQHYRNDPMHGNHKLENFAQAKDKVGALLERLKSLIESLDDTKLITAIVKRSRPQISGWDI